ncbi:response regulator transcription factor [Chitinophaga pinensis]|uniref:Two component transcriptional regulator, winged helix family n=1 Tax=Chitinophaga pinensis (strain ATCC 43595 / DSM 2588 / LMG 13176 / NBRC 15968 / NCIMB 11800 / UQM 2034) TaxID=485918 RepID=A0A979GVS5_CHIPD|nr:response regulator transcription factor [Chitinophaga pinensis]ACU61549.1 two component transcriptional regulator, winged helix family [Chitinophaga pinensis DSM 2588]
MKKIKLLLVEDEIVLAGVVKETLEANGFQISHAENGQQGWEQYLSFRPELCVVDIMMPRKDGLSLVKDIRSVDEQTPIIFLTAKSETQDVIKGLQTGADDYIKKPFSIEELILRIKTLLKRTQPLLTPSNGSNGIYCMGAYIFDYNRQELRHEKEQIRLSLREADILKMLAEKPNVTTHRKNILLDLWGDDNFFNARNMDVYISKIRKYLQHDSSVQLINVRGLGYKLVF